ncbi:unnamed protein product [Timema podura]|uniref:Uncharacterized protein n=1 Tax=Timema podura TaxID=61482 RepID=A0ABN7NT03_TIMPD|nr:unnamed protein product [Timema podura]
MGKGSKFQKLKVNNYFSVWQKTKIQQADQALAYIEYAFQCSSSVIVSLQNKEGKLEVCRLGLDSRVRLDPAPVEADLGVDTGLVGCSAHAAP